MPNTKSAERRARHSARKHLHNVALRSRLKTLEKKFRAVATGGPREAAQAAFQQLSSAFDKAAKVGVVHRGRAARKKSRLAQVLNRVK
ncbi:MAG: 30S ribosomal protein S20 [Verrucomicrobia bacterium]|nr:30S ribosomal protein S20 [Verrucomicrobiota bacterium]